MSDSRKVLPRTRTAESDAIERQFLLFWQKLCHQYQIKSADLPFISILGGVAIYLFIKEPVVLAVGGLAAVVGLGLWYIAKAIPIVERWLGAKIRFWHIASVIIAITAVFGIFDTPARAIFLSGLEQFMIDIASQAGEAAGGEGIQEDTITLIFNIIRGVFLLLVGAAALFAYNQAQQGNDWRPIVTQIGLAFGIVLAIDVITFLFIGDGSGAGGT
ncbi:MULTISPECIES: hypothetical protein [unclassified Coleofasciculus]|uniref:hypothetical protein n=1 Tax=unclassified Coleofasciculus TaxID=2692782 RepID=UPI00187FA59B|nr:MULTISPECIES: hypothetical protein [unclassified Coleofasciculus]MBE9124734.1 hypothetical protein [Coleofasciculus sp. LEGE 07081]MBE9148186.1 hypothetical protein [Coleofasciculus sp. LEGE 07092]